MKPNDIGPPPTNEERRPGKAAILENKHQVSSKKISDPQPKGNRRVAQFLLADIAVFKQSRGRPGGGR